MKVLAIDIGNTRLKWGLHDGAGWARTGRILTSEAARFDDAIQGIDADRIVVSNVAGDSVKAQLEPLLSRKGVHEWVSPRAVQCGVRSGYAVPESLGPDRWAALIAARSRYEGNCLVVCAGTTVTMDALSHEGLFLGGCIVAGFSLMRGAIARDAARLDLQPGEFRYFPDRTADAIWSGTLNAVAGAIDRMTDYMAKAGDAPGLVMLSGGDAASVRPLLNGAVEVVDNLVLEGLVCIAHEGGHPPSETVGATCG